MFYGLIPLKGFGRSVMSFFYEIQFSYIYSTLSWTYRREEDTNVLSRKANLNGHILRRNYLLHADIERQMTKVKYKEEEKHSSLMIGETEEDIGS